MTIVTKTGDKGETGLYGGRRVSKANARIHAYGTVDELNALVGLILTDRMLPVSIQPILQRIQHQLFTVGADLATPLTPPTPTKRIQEKHVRELEEAVIHYESHLPPQTKFLLPGGAKAAAQLHLARTVCRRAERWAAALQGTEGINPQALIYLNRLSDLLFLLARSTNIEAGIEEKEVEYE